MATSIARSDAAQPTAPPSGKATKRRSDRPESKTPPDQGGAIAGVDDQGDWVWLSQFTPTDWEHMICYLWRVEPITDRRRGGKDTSICKITRPFDMDDVMKTYGSGMYRADICAIARTGNVQTRIRQMYFTILNMEYPPRVPFGEWVDDPINAQWKWAGPRIQASEANVVAAAAATSGTAGATDSVNDTFNTVLNGIRLIQGEKDGNEGLAAQVVELLRDQREQMTELMNPATQLATLQSLLALVKPPEAPKSSGVETMFMTFMQDQLKAQREEIRELRKVMADQPQPKSLLDQIKELREAMSIFKGGGGAVGTDWGAVVTGVFEKLSDHMPAIMMMLSAQRQSQPGAPTWPAPAIRAAPPAPPPTQPITQPAAAGPNPQQPAAQPLKLNGEPYTPEELAQEQKIMADGLAKHGMLIQKCVPFMCDMFAATLTGYEFRDWFIAREGQIKWAEVRADFGAERLAALVEMHPVLRDTIKPRDSAIKFFAEFCTAQGDEPDDIEYVDEDPEEIQPAKPRRVKPSVQ